MNSQADKELIAKAIEVAPLLGITVNKEEVDIDKSRIGLDVVILRSADGIRIASISKRSLSGVHCDNPSDEKNALAWAKSMGYPIPTRFSETTTLILVIIGLCIFIIPGLILLIWVFLNRNQYHRDMKALVSKWIDAGRPSPGERSRKVEALEQVDQAKSPPPASTEKRLVELLSMKNKLLITEEEYQVLRKKALDM